VTGGKGERKWEKKERSDRWKRMAEGEGEVEKKESGIGG